ncbi:unnamed protein product, partial [Didymodactylos carnosus]
HEDVKKMLKANLIYCIPLDREFRELQNDIYNIEIKLGLGVLTLEILAPTSTNPSVDSVHRLYYPAILPLTTPLYISFDTEVLGLQNDI